MWIEKNNINFNCIALRDIAQILRYNALILLHYANVITS